MVESEKIEDAQKRVAHRLGLQGLIKYLLTCDAGILIKVWSPSGDKDISTTPVVATCFSGVNELTEERRQDCKRLLRILHLDWYRNHSPLKTIHHTIPSQINSSPNDKIVDRSKLKAFADDKINVT